MHAVEIISTLHQRGITLRVVNGGLKVRGADRLTGREKAALKAHKGALLQVLTAPPTVPIATVNRAPPAGATAATRPLPNRTDPPEPGSTQPFGQEQLDAIRNRSGVWVWSGVLNEWCFWVADEERRRKALTRGIDPAVIWTLDELTGVQSLPADDLRNVAQVKRRFSGTIQPGAMPARWRDAISPLEPAVIPLEETQA